MRKVRIEFEVDENTAKELDKTFVNPEWHYPQAYPWTISSITNLSRRRKYK
jgi:hypothetical protein